MRLSCGAVVGIAKIVAISPSSLGCGGATLAMPGVSATASWSASSCCLGLRVALRGVDREQERAVGAGPNASLSRS